MLPIFLEPAPNYIDESINTVLKIQKNTPSGDILVFLTGKEEIMQAVNTLDDYSTKNTNDKYTLAVLLFYYILLFYDLKYIRIYQYNMKPYLCARYDDWLYFL